jgi:hypothetical protein
MDDKWPQHAPCGTHFSHTNWDHLIFFFFRSCVKFCTSTTLSNWSYLLSCINTNWMQGSIFCIVVRWNIRDLWRHEDLIQQQWGTTTRYTNRMVNTSAVAAAAAAFMTQFMKTFFCFCDSRFIDDFVVCCCFSLLSIIARVHFTVIITIRWSVDRSVGFIVWHVRRFRYVLFFCFFCFFFFFPPLLSPFLFFTHLFQFT